MLVQDYLETRLKLINDTLDQLIPLNTGLYQTLHQAARYSLSTGGKRLRPLIAIATLETFGCPCENYINSICALELIHTYSLIHDDLPCMDNDDFRRGKPTLHKVFNEGQAVLTGDFLLTFAFEVIATDPNLSDNQKVNLVTLLAQKAGGHGMIGGQMLDLAAENISITLEELETIHNHKTGALISTAVEFGAIIAKADDQSTQLLRSFATHIGLAFQIIDDILDITCKEKKNCTGISSDEKNHKTTYVSLMGIEKAQSHANNHYEKACKFLTKLNGNSYYLQQISEMLVNRKV